MPQTSISKTLTKAFAGMLADINDCEIISRTLDDDVVPFGVAVSDGGATADLSVELPDGTGEKIVGLIVHSHEYAKGPGGTLTDAGLLKTGALINILRKGSIYLVLEQDAVYGDRMYIRCTTSGGNTQLGSVIGPTDDSGKTIDARGQIVAMETVAAGSPVLCAVDFTNKP